MSGGAVDADDAGTGVADHGISAQPCAARHVPDVDFLIGQDIRRLKNSASSVILPS